MKITFTALGFPLLMVFILSCSSNSNKGNSHHSEYAGQENRIIKTLSAEDVEALQNGEGWGLAKAAELNGLPGPSHLLDMQAEINLSAEQVAKLEGIFTDMKNEAIPLGEKLIAQERELNDAFATHSINRERLVSHLQQIEMTRSKLRFVHLNAHLQSLPILKKGQIEQYNSLRGYAAADPCEKVPEGHDPEIWREHNNCN